MYTEKTTLNSNQISKVTAVSPASLAVNGSTGFSWWQDIFLLTVILSIFFSILIDIRPLNVPDEARYSEIPREMVITGDYVTPRLNTIKYFEKPALFYWLQATSIQLFGLSEWALRLPTLLLGLIGCIATYATARALYNRRSGWLASCVLSTSILYFAMAHTITLDMTVSIFLTLCLFAFILAIDMPQGATRNLLLWATYAFSALAVLTKGLVGILFPVMVIGSWIVLCNQWRLFLRINLFSGLLIFLAIAVPWHFLAQQANPEFFHFYFVEQQFLRYLTLYAKRYQPDWFFIPVLIIGFFPWIVFLFQALRHHWPKTWAERIKQKKSLFLMLWAGTIFVFFSLSKSKLIPYILPVFPPLAILVGNYLSDHLETKLRSFQPAFLAMWWIALLIGVVLLGIPYFSTVNDFTLSILFLGGMAVCVVWGIYWITFCAKDVLLKPALSLLLSSMTVFLILANIAVAAVDTRSIKPLAMALKEKLKSSDEVMSYHHYYQDLPFYIQQRITVVDCRGELSFGMAHQDTTQFMIDDACFWQRWRGNNNVYAVMSTQAYENLKPTHPDLYLLASTKENVLVGNKHKSAP